MPDPTYTEAKQALTDAMYTGGGVGRLTPEVVRDLLLNIFQAFANDYVSPTVPSTSNLIKGDGGGGIVGAAAGSDYYKPGAGQIPIVDGGTGANTAAAARTNLGIDEAIAAAVASLEAPPPRSAYDLIGQEGGLAIHAFSRTAAVNDLDDALTAADRIDQVITHTRATVGTYWGRDRKLKTAASGELRHDHNPLTGEPRGLMFEPAGENLLTKSEDVADAAWTKTNCTITANDGVGPTGATEMDKIVEASDTNQVHGISQSETYTAAPHTLSVFASPDERDILALQIYDGTTTTVAYFNLTSGTYLGADGTPSAYSIERVADSIYRCSVSVTTAVGAGNVAAIIANAVNDTDYDGDGTSGLHVWGLDLKPDSHLSSYVPTDTSNVTRNAEIYTIDQSQFPFDEDNFTLYVRFKIASRMVSQQDIIHINGPTSENIQIYLPPGSDTVYGYGYANATGQVNQSGGAVVGVVARIGITFFEGSWRLDSNLTAPQTQAFTDNPALAGGSLHIGSLSGGANVAIGWLEELLIFDRAVTPTELAEIMA